MVTFSEADLSSSSVSRNFIVTAGGGQELERGKADGPESRAVSRELWLQPYVALGIKGNKSSHSDSMVDIVFSITRS